ncbi:hypothetical protein [Mycobacterium parmense]|uniref:hypothetical protein n=1 Tax=Mycobacterium parmense TaxID=185642 RepID=UPI0013D21E61|nr:hypothetical protein [Mycobacterium parmense]MCV7351702.1 hypothetical protein [Mycobacterium parmense]
MEIVAVRILTAVGPHDFERHRRARYRAAVNNRLREIADNSGAAVCLAAAEVMRGAAQQ